MSGYNQHKTAITFSGGFIKSDKRTDYLHAMFKSCTKLFGDDLVKNVKTFLSDQGTYSFRIFKSRNCLSNTF
jgi:hypothetical protein